MSETLNNQVIRYYTEEQISPNQESTPEGFLLLHNVPLARTGSLVYLKQEMPWIEADNDGMVHIHRLEEDVFHPNAVASFNGKPVTNDHPPEKVTPDNYRKYTVGTVLNPHRGDTANGESDDLLYADLLVKEREAIADIKAGKRQVSAGYDAKYTALGPGMGQQREIIGNHVALVKAGRCGARCSIMDEDSLKMANRSTLVDRLTRLFKDAEAVEELQRDPDLVAAVVSGEEIVGEKVGEKVEDDAPPRKAKDTKVQDTRTDDGAEIRERLGNVEDAIVSMAREMADAIATLDHLASAAKDAKRDDDDDDDDDRDDDDDDRRDDDDDDDDEDDRRKRRSDDRGSRRAKDRKSAKDVNNTGVKAAHDDKDDDDEEEERRKRKAEESKDAKGGRVTTKDSSALAEVFQDVLAKAEILAPGIRHPTFDAAVPAPQTVETLCNLRREALSRAAGDKQGLEVLKPFLDGREPIFTKTAMTCDQATTIFNGAYALRRAQNNGVISRVVGNTSVGDNFVGKKSPADLNKLYKEYYANR